MKRRPRASFARPREWPERSQDAHERIVTTPHRTPPDRMDATSSALLGSTGRHGARLASMGVDALVSEGRGFESPSRLVSAGHRGFLELHPLRVLAICHDSVTGNTRSRVEPFPLPGFHATISTRSPSRSTSRPARTSTGKAPAAALDDLLRFSNSRLCCDDPREPAAVRCRTSHSSRSWAFSRRSRCSSWRSASSTAVGRASPRSCWRQLRTLWLRPRTRGPPPSR